MPKHLRNRTLRFAQITGCKEKRDSEKQDAQRAVAVRTALSDEESDLHRLLAHKAVRLNRANQ
jgi:hypothetical protein